MTTEEVAKLLRLSVGGIRNRLAKDPQYIPNTKIGGHYRFDKAKVMEHFGFTYLQLK